MKKFRLIAFYLPQFHPTEVNDKYWGKGFTEWTNVAKSKPLFRKHQQPRIPKDLGFYDLRLPDVRKEQAEMAKSVGIEGFCYWHYRFGNGKEVLQMPFDQVVSSGEPDFPFCLGWALHDWSTKTRENGSSFAKDKVIFKQEFPGKEDDIQHFYRLLPAFKDSRYIKVDGKLLFLILVPELLPDAKSFINTWNSLAKENGIPEFHFVAGIQSVPSLNFKQSKDLEVLIEKNINHYLNLGFDAVETINGRYAEFLYKGRFRKAISAAMRKFLPGLFIDKMKYSKVMAHYYNKFDKKENVYPQLLVGRDRSPRSGRKAVIYYEDTPKAFGEVLDKALETVKDKDIEHRIVFINSWNEWGEGAYLEPDLRFGDGKLMEIKKRLIDDGENKH